MNSSSARDRRPELDGLRGFAALIVLVSHVSNATNLWGGMLGKGGGQIGVMLFFALSGYLMGALYLNRPFNLTEARNYAIHRVARVVPLYYAVVLLALIIPDVFAYEVNGDNLITHLLFAKGTSVLWTIPVEIQFYTAFVIIWAAAARSKLLMMALCLAALGAGRFGPTNFPVADLFLVTAPFFVAGLLVSRLPPLAPDKLKVVWSAAFVLCFPALLLRFPMVQIIISGSPHQRTWPQLLTLVVVIGMLITTLRAPIAQVVFGNRVMVFMGTISYSIYLLHSPIISLLQTPLAGFIPEVTLVAGLTATVLLSTFTFYFLERPARRWINSCVGSHVIDLQLQHGRMR